MGAPAKTLQVPSAFRFLYAEGHHRIRASYGGRGSGKSHAFAQALVLKARERPRRILCAREIQLTMKESVKKLLDDKIDEAGLRSFFRSTDSEITGANGSQFIFAGLRTDPQKIKSMEGVDIAWVEEAATVSQTSLDFLTPTIRKPGSEIWFTWNPGDANDPVDKMLRGDDLPPKWLVRRVNWDDNAFFPDVLREEMERDRRRDPDKYAHVWLGEYRRNSEARVFKNWRIEDFKTPAEARFYFGADWGFSVDPTVLVRCFMFGRALYVDQEAYEVGCEIDETPMLFGGRALATAERQQKWSPADEKRFPGVPGSTSWPIIADSARPETISFMCRHGFNVKPARKGPGSLEEGIEFLKSYDIVVHPRCKRTERELISYSYKVDKLTGDVLPVLEDKENHVIDALRYAVEGVRRGGISFASV